MRAYKWGWVGGGGAYNWMYSFVYREGGGLKVGEGLIINWKFMVHC